MKCNNVKVNYQLLLDNELKKIVKDGSTPKLLLHACCAPCSSYCLEYLTEYFDITVLFYNPNITEEKEYEFRYAELLRLVDLMDNKNSITVKKGEYDPDLYLSAVRGLENEPERGRRCDVCYELRLRNSFEYAKDKAFDFITTTLTISPLKKADKLNELGRLLSEEYGIPYLFSDFKKKNGFKRSIELSAQYDLYRQDYCGCVFSKRERNKDQASTITEE